MKIGICLGFDRAEEALDAGFDYIEVGLVQALAADRLPGRGLYSANLFFPADLNLTRDPAGARRHAREAIPRAAEIGLKILVIGGGGARRAPDGTDLDEAVERFADYYAECQAIAREHGIDVAPESLQRAETNVGNDYLPLARAMAARGVPMTADSFHMLQEDGAPDWSRLESCPLHVHLGDRVRNLPDAEDPEILGFFSRLRDLGFGGGVSLECRVDVPLAEAAGRLRRMTET
ncbi:MAG: sugar phosphate isomerase/epimerase [Fimbriimonadaceae bacterium]|nr:sugar phosphate isomerase/epimerase [Fimbriimonadaceae bacterium]